MNISVELSAVVLTSVGDEGTVGSRSGARGNSTYKGTCTIQEMLTEFR